MKRKSQPPLNFRFHGTLDLFQLLDVCMEANIPKVEKAIADWKSQSEIADKCPKICTNQANDCPKICIRGLTMDNMPKYKISIIGDSISTYVGFNPYGYPVYYKDDRAYDNEINSVNDTWWKQVIDGIGGELCINNSYSGSLVAGVFESSACSKERCSNLHGESAPDVILIYMGTNDRGYEIKIGLNEQENTMGFYGAYRVMLQQLKNNYPTTKIVCGTLLMGGLTMEEYLIRLFRKLNTQLKKKVIYIVKGLTTSLDNKYLMLVQQGCSLRTKEVFFKGAI